jgi:hypothetical protein
MKLYYLGALPLLLLASCGPTIEESTGCAEAAATRADLLATRAQETADRASNAAVRALVMADQADGDVHRANDAVARLDGPRMPPRGDLLVKPAEGSSVYWCLMEPPIEQGSPMGSRSIGFYAPLSSFWVGEIFDKK